MSEGIRPTGLLDVIDDSVSKRSDSICCRWAGSMEFGNDCLRICLDARRSYEDMDREGRKR